MKILIFISTMVMGVGHSISAPAADLKSIEARLDEIEKQQRDAFLQTNEEKNVVRPFLQTKILLGGFFETGFVTMDGNYTDSQTNSPGHLLGINIAAEIGENDRFVAQLQTALGYTTSNKHNDPRSTPRERSFTILSASTLLIHAYYEHRFSQAFNIQSGLGYVPFGISYRLKEPLLYKRRGGDAQMVAQSGSTNNVGVAFPLWMGINAHGSFSTGSNRWGYNYYTFTPTLNAKTVGHGARLWYQLENLTIGMSGQQGEQTAYYFSSLGTDLDFKFKNYGVSMEFAEARTSGNGPRAPKSYYVMPYVETFNGKFIFYLIADYLDNPTNWTGSTAATADPYEKWELGAGMNWLPQANVRIRLGYITNDYQGTNAIVDPDNRDYYSIDLSAVVAF